MKSKNLILGVLSLLILVVIFSITTKSQKPTEQGQEYDKGHVIGQGRCPEFISPDTIAFIDNHGFLTIVDLEGKGPKKIGKIHALGFRYAGEKFIFWGYQKDDERGTVNTISTIDRAGKESPVVSVRETVGPDNTKHISAPVVLPDGTVGYWMEQYGLKYFTIIHKGSSPNPLKQWIGDIKPKGPIAKGEVWLRTVDGSDSYRISPEGEREKYYFPHLFSDGTEQCGQKLLVVKNGLHILEFDDSLRTLKSIQPLGNSGNDIGKDMAIDSVTYRIVSAGTVSVSARWSPDCKWVVCLFQLWGTKYNEDEGNPIGSDIQVLSSDGSMNIRIETSNVMESNPKISSDGTVVCETDEGDIIVYREMK